MDRRGIGRRAPLPRPAPRGRARRAAARLPSRRDLDRPPAPSPARRPGPPRMGVHDAGAAVVAGRGHQAAGGGEPRSRDSAAADGWERVLRVGDRPPRRRRAALIGARCGAGEHRCRGPRRPRGAATDRHRTGWPRRSAVAAPERGRPHPPPAGRHGVARAHTPGCRLPARTRPVGDPGLHPPRRRHLDARAHSGRARAARFARTGGARPPCSRRARCGAHQSVRERRRRRGRAQRVAHGGGGVPPAGDRPVRRRTAARAGGAARPAEPGAVHGEPAARGDRLDLRRAAVAPRGG